MEKVQQPIIEVTLEREIDLVIAYKKAMQLAEIAGLNFTEQTKFTTAVSEISRNALVHAGRGNISFYIIKDDFSYYIQAIVSDTGPGIKNLELLLRNLYDQKDRHQSGIINCKRLSDKFDMSSLEGKGTCVKIATRLPANHPPINRLILSGWRKHFSQLAPISPYEELKRTNHLLLKALEDLKLQESRTKEQLVQIQSLNRELELNYVKIKELSNDYAVQNDLLSKRNSELDDFAHILTHDLKSPVQNLKSLVHLIELGRMDDQEKMVAIFKGQLEKMERLIQSILSYSRAGHEKVDKTKVNITKLLQEISQNQIKPDHFVIETEQNLPVLFTEEMLIYQVFSNLITNAVKYNNKKEGRIIAGKEQNEEGKNYFYIEDNGPGIPLNKRENVFNLFTILHNNKDVDSTGIGLAIVKKIIGERGGKIWIEDSLRWDTGSKFCFTWPAEEWMD